MSTVDIQIRIPNSEMIAISRLVGMAAGLNKLIQEVIWTVYADPN